MMVSAEIQSRFDMHCADRNRTPVMLIGSGVDGVVWRVDSDIVVKVYRHEHEFQNELAVYQRLAARGVQRLQGFSIPILLDYDNARWILELSVVFPPFVLDFAAAGLDARPAGFDPDDAGWQAEKQRLFGGDWPDVRRLLDALRQYGIHFSDVHLGNIRVRP